MKCSRRSGQHSQLRWARRRDHYVRDRWRWCKGSWQGWSRPFHITLKAPLIKSIHSPGVLHRRPDCQWVSGVHKYCRCSVKWRRRTRARACARKSSAPTDLSSPVWMWMPRYFLHKVWRTDRTTSKCIVDMAVANPNVGIPQVRAHRSKSDGKPPSPLVDYSGSFNSLSLSREKKRQWTLALAPTHIWLLRLFDQLDGFVLPFAAPRSHSSFSVCPHYTKARLAMVIVIWKRVRWDDL